MIISYSSVPEALTLTNGYSIAGFGFVTALQKLGHKVPYQEPTAPVEICWANADQWNWSTEKLGDNYRIGYSTWESYPIPARWKYQFDQADEVWTTTPLMASWFQELTEKRVKVFEHGVNSQDYTNQKRRVRSRINFLHDGEPSPRKNGKLTLDAFRAAFGDRIDVHLTFKALGMHTLRVNGTQLPDKVYNNVTIDKSVYPNPEDVAALYHRNHVLVCSSEAEGFGLPGLQGIASGMVTICNPGWASYEKFIIPELKLDTKLAPAVHQNVVPGNAFPVDFDDLVDKLRYTAENIESLTATAYSIAPFAVKRYDWLKLTEAAFAPVFGMLH